MTNAFDAPNAEAERERLGRIAGWLKKKGHERVAEGVEEAMDVLVFYGLPETHMRKLRSTSMLERVFEEVKQRTQVVRIFPDEEAMLRLVGVVLMQVNKRWGDRRYVVTQNFGLDLEAWVFRTYGATHCADLSPHRVNPTPHSCLTHHIVEAAHL